MFLTRRDILYSIGSVVVLIFTIMMILVCMLPVFHSYIEQRHEVKKLSFINSNIKWYENYLLLKEEKDEKANYLKDLESKLLYEDELNRLVESIHQLSALACTELVRFQPGPVVPHPPYTAQNIQIFVRGEYSKIIDFLYKLPKMQYYQEFSFALHPQDTKLECVVDLYLYYKSRRRGG